MVGGSIGNKAGAMLSYKSLMIQIMFNELPAFCVDQTSLGFNISLNPWVVRHVENAFDGVR